MLLIETKGLLKLGSIVLRKEFHGKMEPLWSCWERPGYTKNSTQLAKLQA